MSDRELDQQLVERAQRGEKRAFDLLVSKYQRRLSRLLSRFIRDSADIEDVTQEAFVKAYRALPSFRGESAFYTWLYRIGINTAKNFLTSAGRRPVVSAEFEDEDGESLDMASQIPDHHTPEAEMMNQQILAAVNAAVERFARRVAYGDYPSRDGRVELRGNCQRNELPDRHGAFADLPCARSDRDRVASFAGYSQEQKMVSR